MEQNKDSPPRLFVQRPSISAAHSWPRLPALALTNSNEEVELHLSDEENNKQRKKNNNDDDNLSVVSTDSEKSYLTQNEEEDIDTKENNAPTNIEYNRRPSTIQQPSADTLVEAALVQPEARDRHVRFQDHVLTSAAIVQQMLNQTSGNTDNYYPSTTINDHNNKTDYMDDNDLSKMESFHNPPSSIQGNKNTGGSVLGSLMRLEAQRRRREDEYLKEKQLKKEKKLKEKKKSKKPKNSSSKKRHSVDLSELDEKLDSLYTNEKLSPNHPLEKKKSNTQRPKMNRPVSWLSTMSSSHVVPRLETKKKSNKALSRRSSMDSMITTASQFEPITLEDRVRITFEIANILQKQDLLKKLARALMLYGCPAHRLEHAMRLASQTLGVDAEYIYLPNIMLISFFDAATHTTETHFIRQMQSFDMDRLSEVYRLEKLLCHGEVSVDEALEFIDQVSSKPPLYPVWWNAWIYAINAFAGCVMFFGGRWQEGGVAAALAMFFAVYELFSGRIQSFQPIWEITVCIVIGIVAQGLVKYGFCFTSIAFSAFIVILPGYAMAIAIQEVVSRQLISGVIRMVYAILYSFLLGYGVSMGSALYMTIDKNTYETPGVCAVAIQSSATMAQENHFFLFLTVPLFALGYCLFVRAKPHRWPTMVFVAACGFVVNYSLSRWAQAPSQVMQVAPSFVLGLIGHLLTKFTGKMSFDAVLLGIFYLVPSSLGVKAALGLFGSTTTNEIGNQGAGFALAMIESSIGITIGLFLATLLIYPRGTQHTPMLSF